MCRKHEKTKEATGRQFKLMTFTCINDLKKCRRLVIKVGSALLVTKGAPRKKWIEELIKDLAILRSEGVEVILVSSGAIALGAARLGLHGGLRKSLADAQAAASVGQISLSALWARNLEKVGITAAQILISLSDLEDRRRYLNASGTLTRLIEAGAVPVINENDSVATEEIRFGDNDRLAARVAQAARADCLLLLSDVDGLYDRDPKEQGAIFIPKVEGVTAKTLAMASVGSSSGMGSGGMVSKLQAAQIAERAGITLVIVNGNKKSPISSAIATNRGTIFVPQRSDTARKVWISGRLASSGTINVDNGCEIALRNGASLLAAGILQASGSFERGDLVKIISAEGKEIAQGLSEYGVTEVQLIAGKREADQLSVLGYAPRTAVVHRDQMVLL
jgi:glutamate 5-kinase